MLGHVAELQVSMHLPGAGQGADDGAKAAAVDESHLARCRTMARRSRNSQATWARRDSLSLPATIRPLQRTMVTRPTARVSSDRRNEISDAAGVSLPKSLHYSHLFL